jgi:glycosyltransferase involved in cell wall biosynthesis
MTGIHAVASRRIGAEVVGRQPSPSGLSIVHVTAPAEVGGLERVVRDLAVGQLRRGHRVTVVAVVEPANPAVGFCEPLRRQGVEVVLLRNPARAYLRERRLLAALLDERRPQIVHCHGYRPDLLDAGVARARGIPVVTTLHGSSRMGGASRLYEWVQERVVHRFDAVIAVSEPLGRSLELRRVPASRLHVIPNAWVPDGQPLSRMDARRVLGLGEMERVVGWAGRMIPVKGADLFLEAVACRGSGPWLASLIGDGPDRPGLDRRARALGIDTRTRFHGSIPDAGRLFAAFDVFVLSSRSEGTPIVLFEAIASDTPVVATDVGGVADVVGQGGLLVRDRRPATLASAIEKALADRDGARARAAHARQRLEDLFNAERWLEAHERVYRSVLGSAW